MKERRWDIVGLGVVAVDDMLYVDSYPPADAKVRINGCRRQGGGNVSCGLVAAARLGSRCALLGRLGENELSRFARERLSGAGVDLSMLLHDPPAEPMHCTIIVAGDTGSRSIYADFSTIRPLEPGELRPEWFADARIFLVDNLHPPAILPAVTMAKRAGLVVVSDIERDLPELPEIRRHVDHYICSAEFALPYTGCDTAPAACQALAASCLGQSVVVTAGPAGCYWISAGPSPVQHLSAHDVTPVDTTGCGDVFHGAFCHGLARGWALERIIRFANAAAAIKATRTGGWAAVPTLAEVEALLGDPRSVA